MRLLELVGLHLVAEPNAPALLSHVDEDTPALPRDLLERQLYLLAAVAAHGTEDIAGDALGVHAAEHRLRRRDVAADQRRVLVRVDRGAIGVEGEVSPLGGQLRGGHALDQALLVDAVVDELIHSDDLDPLAGGEALQFRHAHHRAVAVHHLADDGRRLEFSEEAEVDGRLGLAGADEDAALAGPQRIDVAGHDDVVRRRGRVGEHAASLGAVGGGDAGGDALAGIDGDGEGGAEGGLVVLHHHRDAQAVQSIAGHRDADDAAGVAQHEGDLLRRGEFGGKGEVALVLAVLVIDDDHEAAGAVLLDRFLDGAQCGVGPRRRLGAAMLIQQLHLRFGGWF